MERLRLANRPLLYVGGGCVQATEALQAFVNATGIPVVQTLMALGSVPASSPTNFGMLGMHGTMAANYAVHNADMLLALGARFDDRVTGKVKERSLLCFSEQAGLQRRGFCHHLCTCETDHHHRRGKRCRSN
jgi:thiamine pyrophosphate-dependent acetolactate synthase large subunit-like protein